MKRIQKTLLFSLWVLVSNCKAQSVAVGTFERCERGNEARAMLTTSLELISNGRFVYRVDGDASPLLRAEGSWRMEGSKIRFTLTKPEFDRDTLFITNVTTQHTGVHDGMRSILVKWSDDATLFYGAKVIAGKDTIEVNSSAKILIPTTVLSISIENGGKVITYHFDSKLGDDEFTFYLTWIGFNFEWMKDLPFSVLDFSGDKLTSSSKCFVRTKR